MDYPKCKICGEKHRLGPEHCPSLKSSGGDSSTMAGRKIPQPTAHPIKPKPVAQPTDVGVAPSPPEAKPKFDRNEAHREYMREYMRKRRAKK